MIGPQELIERYQGFHQDTDFTNVEEIFVNERSGWAQADKALKAVIDAAVDGGVIYIEQELSRLLFDEAGRCTGFEAQDGKKYIAKKTILATGSETAKVLADSAPLKTELQASHRLVAAAVVVGNTKLSPEEAQKYSHIPVNVHAVGPIHGEVMPPTPEGLGYNLKWCRDESFKNTVHHKASGQYISMPPQEEGQLQRTPPEGLKRRLEIVKKGFMGPHAEEYPITSYRVCWDGVTPNQDFIISEHPHSKDLFITAGGSFHGWKFMPIIGKYIVDLLNGNLDSSLAKRWAWDRPDEGAAHGDLLPKIELVDV
ncbi:hypothetical protein MMC25_007037 [Agyrium rufum]|nr:hypothetical protein [Agyrium rufum]